jgi:hypothetical protein
MTGIDLARLAPPDIATAAGPPFLAAKYLIAQVSQNDPLLPVVR